MEMCHPSPLQGFSLPLLIVLDIGWFFWWQCKEQRCQAQITDQADVCIQN